MRRIVRVMTAAALWLCDRIAGPMPETEADRVREREEAGKVVPIRKMPCR